MSRMASKITLHIVLIAGAFLMFVPFLWMFDTALKTFEESMLTPPKLLPDVIQWSNFVEVFVKTDYIRYYFNTIAVALSKTVGQLFFCSLAAFAFATMSFPGKNTLFFIILSNMMVPSQIVIIPTFVLMKEFGWLDSYNALIVPGLASAFGIFLLRQFFLSIPRELGEAAQIDGSSYFRIYWSLYLPLSRSGLTALAIFVLIASWNDFIWPLILTNSDEMRVLSLAVASFVGEFSTEYPLMMAAAFMALLPLVVLFLLLQRFFIEGIALTGMKS
ncbi:carbohydrate ABC transporter membrane protein 2 (CUT1 family) [Paenibacillus cellulosilyticus]|uniref:Carbohydrate ABC transporter membrane protein 2 (CUT1 family) n=1 Tax=Paenibacillus cellulosilyticus TaxID=375489 RepID=A0A2V2YU25_9BACL|nr:carbohydrate ABC transporter permease [Paenibacillus cellulosilyticus]PWW03176.1 carbohydrate ABC transporter membrane protein 2 (CUT1 family) [Paenibacillus cellulosilyticus]QKS43668.1 carbohydrate ABC transporter permease [Paenibacillus cellulosilyticus]